jgi:hypothetical protein
MIWNAKWNMNTKKEDDMSDPFGEIEENPFTVEVETREDVHLAGQILRNVDIVSINEDVVSLQYINQSNSQEIKFGDEEEAREFYDDIVEKRGNSAA